MGTNDYGRGSGGYGKKEEEENEGSVCLGLPSPSPLREGGRYTYSIRREGRGEIDRSQSRGGRRGKGKRNKNGGRCENASHKVDFIQL